MQAIILAAGKGTRMGDMAKAVPKPMLIYRGKNLIEHKLDALPKAVQEVIIVIGHFGNEISKYFGNSYKGLPITYVEQKELTGTASAIFLLKDLIKGKFLSLMGDDIYGKDDLEHLVGHDYALLYYDGDPKRAAGKIILDEMGVAIDIIEDKGGTVNSPLIFTGAFVTTPEIFSYPLRQITGRKEFGISQTVIQMSDKHKFELVEAKFWKQITSPEDLK